MRYSKSSITVRITRKKSYTGVELSRQRNYPIVKINYLKCKYFKFYHNKINK